MPIYAYRCDACGHAVDLLRKVSDPPLSVCPACGADAFRKQVTAAGYQLKGSGWYVTDFRGGPQASKPDGKAEAKPAAATGKSADAAPAASAKADAPAPGKSTSAAAPAPAPTSGGSSGSAK